MKNLSKTIVMIIMFIIGVVLFRVQVNAADDTSDGWTDFSKAKVVITQEEDLNRWTYTIKVTGVNFKEDSFYKLYFRNGEESQHQIPSNFQELFDDHGDGTYINKQDGSIKASDLQDAIKKNGDIYCYVVEAKQTDKDKVNIYKAKIDRPRQHSLGNRMRGYFFDKNDVVSGTDIFLYEEGGLDDKKVNLKIGQVTDQNILKSIQNGESDCLQKLMDYSKSAKSIYTGTVPLGQSDTITDKMNLIDRAYYYVYMEVDDENGTYYPIEDISLYQAIDNNGKKNLLNYFDSNFKWNLSNNPAGTTSPKENVTNNTPGTVTGQKDTTVATKILPNTGISIIIGIAFVIVVIGMIVSIKKYNKYKGIK